jgi:inhibitor of KinA sporulation pathway (predicted exonuclease)
MGFNKPEERKSPMIMVMKNGSWVQWDTEYTTWTGARERCWGGPGEYREIVQIAAIRVVDGVATEHFLRFVKPVKNPILSEFFTNLTGIEQSTVDEHGMTLAEALNDFHKWIGDLPVYAFGQDHDVVKANADLLNLPWTLSGTSFFDIREVFHEAGVSTKGYQSSSILCAFGKKPFGRAHDALDDVRNVLAAWHELPK